MKKLTAGIFATILGLTAVDAFAAQVASTNYVQGAIQSLDSSVTATAGTALTGVTVVDGKITGKTEAAIPSLTGYATESWVEGKGYAVATQVAQDIATATTDMATKTQVAQDIATATTDMATQTWVGEQGYLKEANLNGYATESWVEGKGYAVATQVAQDIATATTDMATKTQVAQDIATATTDMATKTQVAQDIATATTDMATKTQVAQDIATATTDMATQTWVGEQGYLKEANLNGYATESWVEGKGYVTTTTFNEGQTTQNTAIEKAQKDATQALADAAAENEVNATQQQVINALDVTYVKVSDVVDTYVAPTAL